MLILDPVKDFYRKLQGRRVLLLVSWDVDALAACKILQSLFRSDQIQYTLIPVKNQTDVQHSFERHQEQYHDIVLLNCGGNIDLLDLLQPPDHTVIYVIDNHRPVDLVNYYCERQVYLLMRHNSTELSAIPDYDDLYKDEHGDSESSASEDEMPPAKSKRFDEGVLEKRRQRRLWEEKRKEIIFEYEEFSYYGESSAFLVYELAWKMSKDSVATLWWGIVGVTDQFQNKKIGRDKYFTNVVELQGHMSRLNHRNEGEEGLTSVNCMKLSFEYDLDLVLYRHWSLFESLCHSPLTSTAFKVWTVNGLRRLHLFLADMGIPLIQCKQNYAFMDSKIRENLQSIVEESAEKFGLTAVRLQSFSAQIGYVHKLCASDIIYSVNALLEDDGASSIDDLGDSAFAHALDAVAQLNSNSLKRGITLAKEQMLAMKNLICTFIKMGHVLNYGPFLYAVIRECDNEFPCSSIYMNYFTQHLLDTYHKSLSKLKKDRVKNLPLIVSASLKSNAGSSIMIGVPPLAEESRKNLFGRAFLYSAKRTNSEVSHEFFDPCIITIKSEDLPKFLDALITIMS